MKSLLATIATLTACFCAVSLTIAEYRHKEAETDRIELANEITAAVFYMQTKPSGGKLAGIIR